MNEKIQKIAGHLTGMVEKCFPGKAGRRLTMTSGGLRTIMAAGLFAIGTLPVHAATFIIGSADGSFENGLGGMTVTGTVNTVPGIGILQATQGAQTLLMTTEPDQGSTPSDAETSVLLIENFTVGAEYATLRLDYNFMTNEPEPSYANDEFTVRLMLVSSSGEEQLLATDTFASFFPAPWTGYNVQTGFHTLIADLSAYAGTGELLRLKLRISDIGDGRRDSAVLVDNMRLVEPGYPTAVADVDYLEVDTTEEILFDASGSSDNGTITQYLWDFANGWQGIGTLVSYAYPEEGVYQGSLTVTDDEGNTDTTNFTVVVGNENHPPSITSAPLVTAAENAEYRYQVVVDDPEIAYGDSMAYTLSAAPAGMTVDVASGLISWTPTAADPRKSPVTVRVEDSRGLTDSQTFNVTIGPAVYVATINGDSRFYTARSNGDGSFSDFRLIEDIGTRSRGIAIGDLNGDGDFDLVTGYSQDPNAHLYYYERSGSGFENPVYLGSVGGSNSAGGWLMDMAVEDFNNDGSIDILVNGDSANSWYLENSGEFVIEDQDFFFSGFESGTEGWGGQQCSTSWALDTSTANSGTTSARVFATNNGACMSIDINPSEWFLARGSSVSFAYRIPAGNPVGLLFSVSGFGWIYLGGSPAADGDIYDFPEVPKVSLIADDQWHTVTFDLRNAIRKHWPTASQVTEFEWWTNSNATAGQEFWFDDFHITRPFMSAGFTTHLLPSTGGNGRGLDAADTDGDGDQDFARGRTSSGYIYHYTNDGDGNFTASTSQVADPGNDPYGVVLADFDNDGMADLIANNNGSGDPYFFKGNGNGTFQAGVYIPSLDTNNYTSLADYDFNNDGSQDLVAGNYTSRQFWYYPGNGDGTFGTRVLIGTPASNNLSVAAPAGRVIGQPFVSATQDKTEIDEGNTVIFDASASYDDGTIDSYEWDFGDGNTATGVTATNTFASEGTYKIVLTTTDDDGLKDRLSLFVTVNGELPTADAGGPYILAESVAVNGIWSAMLDGSGSSDPDTAISRYEWDFDDSDGIGVDAVGVSPIANYSAPGTYTLTLTVYDEVGQLHIANGQVVVTAGDAPVAALAGPTALDENDASLGKWFGIYDMGGSSDTEAIANWSVDWGDGAVDELHGLKDNFDDGDISFNPLWTVNGGNWFVDNQQLRQTDTVANWRWVQDLTTSYGDFQLEVDFKGDASPSGNGYMGIVFRNANTKGSTNSYLMYSRDNWDFWRFYDWKTGSVLIDGGTGWDPDIWYHLRLVMVDSYMQLFVTPEGGVETLMIEVDNSNHPTGGIGLLSNGLTLTYDNVVVTPLARNLELSHLYTATGNYPVTLTVTDHAGQSDSTLINLAVTANAPPVADAGGPYVLDEGDTLDGEWAFILDASGSSDDVNVERYRVDFGDGNSYTSGLSNGIRGSYFVTGTDLYGYDVVDARLRRVIATEDNTQIDLINLQTKALIASTTLNRMQSWNDLSPGDGVPFKIEASKPVAAYLTDLVSHSAFMPSLGNSPLGKEFIFLYNAGNGFFFYAHEDTRVDVFNTSGALVQRLELRAGEYGSAAGLSTNNIYRVQSSGLITMQTVGGNGYTTVPSDTGDSTGQLFYFATHASTSGAFGLFAYDAADVEVFDMDSGASLYTRSMAAGESWFQNGVGTRRLRLAATGDVEVWAGDTEGGSAIANLGDDISVTAGREGTEFVLHNLADGIVIFAPNNNTDIDVDSGALTQTLQRDGYLLLAPTDFPSGSGVHRITTSQPVVIQTLGRANTFNDLGTYLGGVSMRHRYTSTGTYTVSVTAVDNAGQTHTDSSTVEVKVNDLPVAVIDAPAVVGESFATGGLWSVAFDAGNSTDDFGISSYAWDFGDGTSGSGVNPIHEYSATGTYTVTLTVTDHAGQQTVTTFIVNVTLGDGPTADAGGPYVFGEESASFGVWTATLDGTGSSDDTGIYDYLWDFGPALLDEFTDGVVDATLWNAVGAVETGGKLEMTGVGNWSTRGFYSEPSIARKADLEFTGQVLDTTVAGNGRMMWGVFKNSPSSFSYTQMHHALYFDNGTLRIYEDGSSRGTVGSYTRSVLYDVKIVVKSAGANYFIKPATAAGWTPLTSYSSLRRSATPLRIGASVLDSMWEFDDQQFGPITQVGSIITREYQEIGTHPVTLTVRDNALQADSDSTTIEIQDGAPPVADAGGNYTAEVGSFIQFNGGASTDDVAIQTYDWLFGDTTGGASDLPFTGQGATPRHFYQQIGTYIAQLTVTDNTLKSDSATTSVNVIIGNPPVASGQAVSQGAANGPPVYFNAESSTDDYGIVEYRWDFDAETDRNGDGDPTNDVDAVGARPFHTYARATTPDVSILSDDFEDGVITGWTTNGTVMEEGGGLQVTGITWGSGYAFTDQTFDRSALRFTARVETPASGYMMLGVKNNNTASGHYNQLHHAIYFANGALQIYEDGSSRGSVGSYTPGETYEVRIDIQDAGADYYFRQSGASSWTPLTSFSSLNRTGTPLRIGMDAHSGVWGFDNVIVQGTGPNRVTLTVEDGAGQTSSTQFPVEVTANLPPDVIAVPWVAHDLLVPHETYNGTSIRLKGIVRDADAQSYQWDFGDGTLSAVTSISNKYDLSVSHTYPDAPNGTPFVATLKVWDSLGQMGQDSYNLVVKPRTLSTETNVAIDEGLWYLHQQQTRTTAEGYDTGYWTSNARASATASSIQAFLINSHLESADPAEDPYQETVMRGLRQLFRDLGTVAIATQTHGEPDTDGNNLGIQTGVNNSGGQPIYQGGQVMDAIASTGTPLARALTGSSDIKRRSYFDILTDMADQFGWGQTEQGSGGGWRYSWNNSIDQSAAQWGAIGLLAAEDIFGIPVPQWVKDRNLVWLNASYGNPGWGYTSGGTSIAGTPSGLVQMVFDDQTKSASHWQTAEKWIADVWDSQYIVSPGNRPYYQFYAATKAMRLAKPEPVVKFASNGFDWFSDPVTGLARTLIDDQEASGRFPGTGNIRDSLRSAWGVIMLSRTLFVQPPVADAGRDRVWAVDLPLEFDGSNSFHLDPFRGLVKYEWDFDGDGNFDSSSAQPTATHTYLLSQYPEATLPQTLTATLRVTDNNVPPLQDTDTVAIIIAIPPHPPIAEAGGPYTCTLGLPCALDGSGSFDIDPTDFIARYEWELDGIFPFDFDEESGAQPAPVFDILGTHNIGLRVWDNGVLNDLDGDDELDENERLSDQHFTLVTVVENQPPVADATGPYNINEGASALLNGTGSGDPNGDPLQYAWDLDNDGLFDDATGASPGFTRMDDGIYPIHLMVSDGLLSATASTTVTVNNVAPAVDAGPDQAISEADPANFSGSFFDPGTLDTHTIEWDFGDGSSDAGSLNTSHDYADNGVYSVTLTVTDDDGGVGSDTLIVTVGNVAPMVEAGLDQETGVGNTISLDPASFIDAGVEDTHTASIDWGDGTVEPGVLTQGAGSGSVAGSHSYAANGGYTVTVTVTDDDGGVGSDSFQVTVATVIMGPIVDAGGPYTIDEGSSVILDGSGSSDPDSGPQTLSYAWDLDSDGQYDDATGVSVTLPVQPDDASFSVGLQVSDGALTATDTAQVTVNNVPPAAEAGPDQTIDEGATASFSGSFSDPGLSDNHTIEWNFGDGTAASGTLTPSHTYADNGTYTVTLTVTDDDGGVGTDALTLTVNNVPPAVEAGPDQTIDEGATASFSGSFSDPGLSDSHTIEWDFGDGATASGTLTPSHTYADNGTYTVTLTVADDDGGVGTDALTLTVNNVPPTVEAGPDQTVDEGTNVGFSGSFSDPGLSDSHTIEWDFGDGATASGTLTPSHTYADNGAYTVTLTVTDNDGGAGSDTLTVLVNDLGPGAVLTGDTALNEGQAGGYDASGSSSSPDAIVLYEWDWAYNGSTFSPSGDTGVTQSYNWGSAGSYTVALRVTDEDGSVSSATLSVTVESTVEPPVQTIFDLTARPKPTEVFLMWTPVPGANSYNVYRSTTAGGPYTQIASNHICDYCAYWDPGLSNDVTYYYKITSVSGGSESLPSNEASATPRTRSTRRRR